MAEDKTIDAARCRGCASDEVETVLDLGNVPAADSFPLMGESLDPAESSHPLQMILCRTCGLAQLYRDDTQTDEPRGIEPQVLRDQAVDAVQRVDGSGWLRGRVIREFGSPHGGSWLPLLVERGFSVAATADVVLDCFGIMHEPDQGAAFQRRSTATHPDGVLLLQFHSLLTIVAENQWNALRHGHFAYYSLTALVHLLDAVGMSVATAWEFDLYGGTVLIAAVHGRTAPDERVTSILRREADFGITDPAVVGRLQQAAERQSRGLREWLEGQRAHGRTVYGYGAASRAVALLSLAGVTPALITAVADASPSKQGRRMPGTDVPIVSPEELIAGNPGCVLLTVPDIHDEVAAQYPSLEGRWYLETRDGVRAADRMVTR